MKTIKFFALTLLLLTVQNCSFYGIAGNGKIVTKKITNIKNITDIKSSGAYDLEIYFADSTEIEITGDENLLPFMTFKIKDNKLIIDSEESLNPSEKIKIKIVTPSLNSLYLSGAFDVNIHDIRGEKFTLDCGGATDVDISGKVEDFFVDVSGSSEIDAANLEAENVKIDISGASDITVFVTKKLFIDASGAASINYLGNPKLVNSSTSGAVEVNKIHESEKE